MTAVATRLTLEEFLRRPETEPASEFVCGEVIPKPMPNAFHGAIVMYLGHLLLSHILPRKLGWVLTETRHADSAENRSYLPDVSVLLRRPGGPSSLVLGPLWFPPDLAVEVSSPDDRPTRIADKLAFYLRAGVPLVWIIDPEERSLVAYRPGQQPEYFRHEGSVSGDPVLPGLILDLAGLFSVLEAE
ncbi:MAG: Uma2 family endonuclease [Dehalococcoidia bacterium]